MTRSYSLFLSLTLLLLTSIMSFPSQGQVVELVKDLYPGPTSSLDLNPVVAGGTIFFRANDGVSGTELWTSDGTTAGTVLVKDIYAGVNASTPAHFRELGGELYFAASSAVIGRELWKSDGTDAGTVLVKDIRPSGGSSPSRFMKSGGQLFFAASDGTNGEELWKTDGTAAGTVLVKDINPSGSSQIGSLADVNGTLFFSANDGTNGFELWKSDGTPAGTVLVKDIIPGSGGSSPRFMTAFGGEVFFQAVDGINGNELWKSDGTAAGTVLVKDVNPGTADGFSGYFAAFTEVSGELFFTAYSSGVGRELWKTDGTAAGTVLVKDINPGGANSDLRYFTDIGGELFVQATDATNGAEVWKSDGTAAGTVLLKDINPGPGSSSPSEFIQFGSHFYFPANDGVDGYELWKSDGTAAGTTLAADINPGPGNSGVAGLTVAGGDLFFRANSGSTGSELWIARGSAALPTFAYVTNSIDATVTVINTATNVVHATITGFHSPFGVAASPDGAFLYVTETFNDAVRVVSTATNTIIGNIPVGDQPRGLAVSTDGFVYVANDGDGTISVIDTSTNTVVATDATPVEPQDIAFTPDGTTAYVADYANIVPVYETTGHTLTTTISVACCNRTVAVTPDGTRAYVGGDNSGVLRVIDTATNSVVATIGHGLWNPFEMAMAPDGTYLYVATFTNKVTVVNTATNTVDYTVAVPGTRVFGVAVTPDGQFVYAADNTGVVSVITANVPPTLVATIPYGSGFGNSVLAGGVAIASPPQTAQPIASAGPDQTVECGASGQTAVTLDGTGSSDPDNDPLTYSWTDEGGQEIATGSSPTVNLALGTHTITLTVDDGTSTATDQVVITVADTTPPTVTLDGDAEISLLCAIDTYIEPGASAEDTCDGALPVSITGSVDENTPGAYTLTYTATDGSGNSGTEQRTITVLDVSGITGTVTTTSDGSPLAGVTVKLLDTGGLPASGFDPVVTDAQGMYGFDVVPGGDYQIMIVEPLGYSDASGGMKPATITCGSPATVDFALTHFVTVNEARSKGYWKHQFDVYVKGKGNAQESEQDLLEYIVEVESRYTTPHYQTIFQDMADGVDDFEEWQATLSVKNKPSMEERATAQLGALVLNVMSLKVGQYELVTDDDRDVGDVIIYVSELVENGDASDDELAKDLAESVNNHQPIAAGIVPASNVVFKTAEEVPDTWELHQNYPNPFNPVSTITYGLLETAEVTLRIFDVLGREVQTLTLGQKDAGRYRISIDAGELSSGTYFYRLEAGDFAETKTMVVLK